MNATPVVSHASGLLERSRATRPFRDALLAFMKHGHANDRIQFDAYSPPVKVERTLTKLLEANPELEIERVTLDGSSGCEFYRGTLRVETTSEPVEIAFEWNCKWRAVQQGWTDYFGFPDQARAAREFGHDCFRRWEAKAPK